MTLMNLKSLFAVFVMVYATGAVQGAYEPQVKPQPQGKEAAVVRAGTAALRALPPAAREAYFAEKLGLLILPNGESGYSLPPHMHMREGGVKLETPRVHPTALYVGSDGLQHEYADAIRSGAPGDSATDATVGKALKALYQAREEAVLSSFADEVTKLCLKAAKDRMEMLLPRVREALLAELGGWVYRQPSSFGSSEVLKYPTGLYSCGRSIMRINHHAPKQKFLDAKGMEQDFQSIVSDNEAVKAHAHAWNLVILVAQYIGAEDVLALYPEESAAMRSHYSARAAK